MSQSVEAAQLREKAKRLVAEIDRLSVSDVPPDRFFNGMLDRTIEVAHAVAAGVWLMEEGGLRPAFHRGLIEAGYAADPDAAKRNEPLLRDALGTGESMAYLPDAPDKPLPTHHLYLVAAVSAGAGPVGVLQVLMRPQTPAAARPGLLQFVEQAAGFASRYLSRHADTAPDRDDAMTHRGGSDTGGPFARPAAPAASPTMQGGAAAGLPPAFWQDLEKFLLQLERGRTVAEVAASAASDGRLLLGVDRVALVRRRGRRTVVEAISGQDKVNRRANLVRRMADLSRVVMDGRTPLFHTGRDDDELPPPLEQPLAEYIAEANSRLIVIVPLFEPAPLLKPEFEDKELEHHRRHADPKVIGCLVAEQINDSRVPPALRERIDVAADHVAAALAGAATFDNIFLRRPLLAVGRTGEWFQGRKLPKTLAVLAAAVAVGLALWLVPYQYNVVAEGRLMPVVQRDVFAPWDGEVTRLEVKGGERVEAGEVLASLRNDDLRADLVRIDKELNEKRQTVVGLTAQIDEARNAGKRAEEDRLAGERLAAEAEVVGLTEQLKILNERQERLTVPAPIDGVVATFQLDQRLRGRPVRRGEVLMEVMDDRGDWHLELDVEDRRMGHLLQEMETTGSQALPVKFVLATDPEATFAGTLSRVASRAETEQEKGNVVRVDVAIADPAALPDRRIGAEVRAKIDCGDKPLGYVLFGDVIEFLQKHLWLWF